MAEPKTKPICSECGSDDVLMDAYARWDVDAQEWVLNSTHDDTVCERCEGECSLDWEDVA